MRVRQIAAIAVALLAAILPASAQAQTNSVVEFEQLGEGWKRFIGLRLSIEGRVAVFGSDGLRFVGSNLRVELKRGYSQPQESNVVEVTGVLEDRLGRPTLKGTSIRGLPADSERLQQESLGLDARDANGRYQLARWAEQRGKFYDDPKLQEQARALREEAIRIEYNGTSLRGVDALRALARKAADLDLSKRLQDELLHAAAQARWRSEMNSPDPDFEGVLDQLHRDLPASLVPVRSVEGAPVENYRDDPRRVYAAADEEERTILARVFHQEVSRAWLENKELADGRNGEELAEMAKTLLPERPELSRAYLENALRYLSRNVASLSRSEVVSLAERFHEVGRKEQGEEALRSWLEAKRQGAVDEGPRALLELADEYVRLLKDERTAGELYIEAYRQDPSLDLAADWLMLHGYERVGGVWRRTVVPPRDGEEGGDRLGVWDVKVGMTAKDVRTALRVLPDETVRMATLGKMSELWVYHDYDLALTLSRSTAGGELRVTAINEAAKAH